MQDAFASFFWGDLESITCDAFLELFQFAIGKCFAAKLTKCIRNYLSHAFLTQVLLPLLFRRFILARAAQDTCRFSSLCHRPATPWVHIISDPRQLICIIWSHWVKNTQCWLSPAALLLSVIERFCDLLSKPLHKGLLIEAPTVDLFRLPCVIATGTLLCALTALASR